jgi:hypothetical protein
VGNILAYSPTQITALSAVSCSYCLPAWRGVIILRLMSFRCSRNATLKRGNSVALSPQTNCTDLEAATGRPILVPTSADRGMSRGQRGGSPTVVNLGFIDRSR